MKREIQCRLCNAPLGKLERHQVEFALTHHFRSHHRKEYEEIKQAYEHYKFLRSIHKFDGSVI